MHVQFLNSPAFAIDETGKLTRSAVWLLCCDTPQEDIAQLAEQWAGSVGSPWRVPDAAGESYLPDNSMQITQINCKPLDSCSCEVTLYGTKVTAENSLIAIPGSFTFERRKDLSEYRSCRFKLRGSPEEILPVPGDLIAWAGNGYRCESVEVTGDPSGESVVCITAVNTSITGASDVVSESSSDFQQIKKGSWLILPDALEDFLAANKLHSAAPWAGENYYVSHIKTQDADSANRTLVTLQARYADLKMIESLRHEEVVAMPTFYGSPKKLLVWTSVWRARPEDQMFFESMLGNNAGDWTGDYNTVVCKVEPKRISDQEFEYHLEARYPENIGQTHDSKAWHDDDLPNRVEYYMRSGELRLSPLQCGYSFRTNGNYVMINRWQPSLQCPLLTTQPLPFNWINQSVKVLEILEVSYAHGTSAENLQFYHSFLLGNKVSYAFVGNIYGNFLNYDLDIDDMTDQRGRQWTRITKIYRLAPSGYDWNSNYWI